MATIQQTLQQIRESIKTLYPSTEGASIAQMVMEYVLQKSRIQLSLSLQEEVDKQQAAHISTIIKRLQQQEPVQYILGIAHFYDLELLVNEHVLIPRPETEELVHLAIKEHQAQDNLHILDICSGSGCISLALASNLKYANVYGLEISGEALQVAKQNADKYKLTIDWLHQDIFDEVQAIEKHSLDIITSNPPYVLEEEKELMRPNVLQYEPHLALFVPDNDPLKYYRRIALLAFGLLKPGGKIYFEINERYGKEVKEDLLRKGFLKAEIRKDLFGKDRIVRAIK